MLYRITIAQSRYLNPSTAQRYLQYCAKYRIVPKAISIEPLGDKGRNSIAAQWLGDPNADIVLLFLHGGGYTQPSTEGYYEYWHGVLKLMNASTKTHSVALLQLDYTLVPEAQYPTQLQEAAAITSYLLHVQHRSPSSIVLVGDSAGGNLCLSLLSHLSHAHPDVLAVEMSAPFLGLLLYSPWVSFRTDFGSFDQNAEVDVLEPTMLRRWAAMYLGKSKPNREDDPGPVSGDSYSEPLSNDASWWSGMHRFTRDVLVVSGGEEMFAEGVTDFCKAFRRGWIEGGGDPERARFVQAAGRVHIDPILSVSIQSNERGDDQAAVEEWLHARLAK